MSETKSTEMQIVTVPQDEKGTIEVVPFGTDERIKLNVKIVRELVAVATRTGKLPTDKDCIKFMMLCRARHLNPFEGDAYMLGYDTQSGPQFSLITAHQVFLKRAEASKGFKGMQSGVIVRTKDGEIVEREGDFTFAEEKLLGGWAKVYRKELEFPFYRRLKLETFSTGRSRWEKDPAGMVVKCAEADALRTAFPTHLGGLYIAEEPQAIDIGPKIARAKIELPASAPTEPDGHRSESASGNTRTEGEAPEGAERNRAGVIDQTDSGGGQTGGTPKAEASSADAAGSSPVPSKKKPQSASQSDTASTDSPLIPKRKAKEKPPSTETTLDHPEQIEMLGLLKLGGYTTDDLLTVCKANDWCPEDATWPLTEENLARLLKENNKIVVMAQLEELPRIAEI